MTFSWSGKFEADEIENGSYTVTVMLLQSELGSAINYKSIYMIGENNEIADI